MEYASTMGGHETIDRCMKMTPKEFYFWLELWERKQIKDGIVTEFVKKNKPIPSTKRLNSMVDKKIAELSEG